ncbi:Hypothetical predicted protein [Octopus vulgaris]|uniref:Uncharacterized protein n=1 Tax=Octopus vulgaris TaxID=6645 RepID=A0AA36F936_OCTVU|nr:Hypothetical predicted protein [Octopus vulgaris]
MPPKHRTPSKASGSEPKRQKKVMTFHEKVQLLDMLQEVLRHMFRNLFHLIKSVATIFVLSTRGIDTLDPNSNMKEFRKPNPNIDNRDKHIRIWADQESFKWFNMPSLTFTQNVVYKEVLE